MAKRGNRVLMDMLANDARLRAAPLAAQAVWMRLMVTMDALGISVLRFGSMPHNLTLVSKAACIDETELETHLAILVAYGLLRLEPDGAIAAPIPIGTDRRAEAARINGLKGGRPRKHPDGKQREMAMAISGGKADFKTEPAASVSTAIAKLESIKAKKAIAVADADVERIGLAALAEGGLDGQRCDIVRKWLQDGATEHLITETIHRKMAGGAAPKHLGYFDAAIRDAMTRPPASDAPATARSRAFQLAMDEWMLFKAGPVPHPSWFNDQGVRAAA